MHRTLPKDKVPSKVLGLEGKYGVRMFGGTCVANSWQFAHDKLVKKFIEDYSRNNNNAKLSDTQIRKKVYKLILEGHVPLTAME